MLCLQSWRGNRKLNRRQQAIEQKETKETKAPKSMVSFDQFLEFAVASGLVSQNQLDFALEGFCATTGNAANDDSLPLFVKWLERQRSLTAWQGAKLLDGKYKGFQIGPYLLLDHLGTGSAITRYLAVDTRSQAQVEIAVVPPSKQSAYLVIPLGALSDEGRVPK